MLAIERTRLPPLALEGRHGQVSSLRHLVLSAGGAALACVAAPGWVALCWWIAGRSLRRIPD
jgi:hypothetical protein